jgi:DNA-binding CsgD family transcriptional regulator
MHKSQQLRLADVRAVYRMVGECRELGADAMTWRSHLAAGLCRLTGAQVGFVGEAESGSWKGQMFRVFQAADAGWASPKAQAIWLGYMAKQQYNRDPIISRVSNSIHPGGAYGREQLVPDREWYRSTLYRDYLTPTEIDDALFSFFYMPKAGGNISGLITYRALRDRRFAQRECAVLQLCHEEIVALAGTVLATAREPSVSRLSPRLRQVLGALLEGDSEKQVGKRLGLRPDTVREYVLAIYRHFGVCTRAELLAYFLRRSGLRLPEPSPGPTQP